MVRGSATAVRLSYALHHAKKDVREHAMKEIGSALRLQGGDIAATAEYLEVGRVTLHRWIAGYSYLQQVLNSARLRGRE